MCSSSHDSSRRLNSIFCCSPPEALPDLWGGVGGNCPWAPTASLQLASVDCLTVSYRAQSAYNTHWRYLICQINVLPRMNRRYCKHVICLTCMQHRQCLSCQHRERLCATESIIQSYLSFLVSQTPSLGSEASQPPALQTQLSYP